MKIYLLTDEPYHDNEAVFGAYSTEEKARVAQSEFVVDPVNGVAPTRIAAVELDAPASLEAAQEIPS